MIAKLRKPSRFEKDPGVGAAMRPMAMVAWSLLVAFSGAASGQPGSGHRSLCLHLEASAGSRSGGP